MGGRPRVQNREGVRGRGHIWHHGEPTGVPADAVGGRENPSPCPHHVEDRPSGARQVRAGDGEAHHPRRRVRDTPAGGEHPDRRAGGRAHRGADGRHGGVLQPPAVPEHPARHGLQRPARALQRAQAVRLRGGQVHEEIHRGPGHRSVRAADVRGVRRGQGDADHLRRAERPGAAHHAGREVRREDDEQDAPEPRLHRRVPPWRHRGRGRHARAGGRGDLREGAAEVRREQAQGFPAGARHGRERRPALLADRQGLLREVREHPAGRVRHERDGADVLLLLLLRPAPQAVHAEEGAQGEAGGCCHDDSQVDSPRLREPDVACRGRGGVLREELPRHGLPGRPGGQAPRGREEPCEPREGHRVGPHQRDGDGALGAARRAEARPERGHRGREHPRRVVRGRAHHQGVLREVPARGLRQSRDPRPGAGVFRR